MQIYKTLQSRIWGLMQLDGETGGNPNDAYNGYIRLETAAQLKRMADLENASRLGMTIAAFDADAMGDDLEWEGAYRDDPTPVLYNRNLRMDEVLWTEPVLVRGGKYIIPKGVK